MRDGRIRHVGASEEAARFAGDGVRVIDLEGRMLLPGFVESHTHPAVAGLLNSKLQIIGTRTVADVQAALKAYADAHPGEKALFGFGFPSALNTTVNAAGVKGPYRKDLDAVVSDRPVVLIALDAHSAWVNSKALEVAGITKGTPDPVPGVHYYQRDGNGEPTGWMVEGNAFWPLLPRFGIGSEADFRAAFSAILPGYSAMGITAVFDAGIPGGDALLRNALKALASLERDGNLPLRYRASVYLNRPEAEGADMVRRIAGIRRDFASGLIDVHTVKIRTTAPSKARPPRSSSPTPPAAAAPCCFRESGWPGSSPQCGRPIWTRTSTPSATAPCARRWTRWPPPAPRFPNRTAVSPWPTSCSPPPKTCAA